MLRRWQRFFRERKQGGRVLRAHKTSVPLCCWRHGFGGPTPAPWLQGTCSMSPMLLVLSLSLLGWLKPTRGMWS